MLNEIVGTMSFLQPEANDDGIDRLNYYYTSTSLIVSALLISIKMFGGRPLECWLPAEYTSTWESYSEMYCWAQNTYFASFDDQIPESLADRKEKEVSYYQWAPFFLILLAFLFYLPCLLWRFFNDKSGVRLIDLVGVASDKLNVQADIRNQNVRGLANHLTSIFKHQYTFSRPNETHRASMHRFARWLNLRYCSAFMTLLYLFIKTFYLVNSVGLLFLMNRVLQTDGYGAYGFGVIKDLFNGREWQNSGNFPRVTLCDMQIRVLGNVQLHTVQCVMVINIFLEKLFIMLWIWFSVLSFLNLLSLVFWIQSSLFRHQRFKFVCRRLELADAEFHAADHFDDVNDFVDNWVKMDGIFVLRIIAMHSGAMICTEVLDAMWDLYEQEKGVKLVSRDEETVRDDSESVIDVDSPPSQRKRKPSMFAPLVSETRRHEFRSSSPPVGQGSRLQLKP